MLLFCMFVSDLDKHQYEYTGSGAVKGRHLVSQSGDILLGTVSVPLINMLTHKTGNKTHHT